MKMTNKTYDILKYIAQIVLPALGTFWLAIANIWGLPLGMEIGETIIALDTFLGLLLRLSTDKDSEETDEVLVDPSVPLSRLYAEGYLNDKTKAELMVLATELSLNVSNKLTKQEIIEKILDQK